MSAIHWSKVDQQNYLHVLQSLFYQMK